MENEYIVSIREKKKNINYIKKKIKGNYHLNK